MPRCAVLLPDMRSPRIIWLLATLVALAAGFPAKQDDEDGSSGPLPFIQFTKGGIRVNFGGYHAQAGLGGLLTGSKADGGLHASAGTPDGIHASAGLGGSLDGGPAGGLHARAGLGNGGPEAEAGLSGSLVGKPRGELYAGSTAGDGFPKIKINSIDRAETSANSKNVQVIPRVKKADQEQASSATSDTVSKVKESSSSSSSSSASAGATANAGASANDGAAAAAEGGPTQEAPQEPTKPAKKYRPGIFARATVGDDEDGGGRKHKSTLFDDIFNIPISALNAVNQLLRNHVGKK